MSTWTSEQPATGHGWRIRCHAARLAALGLLVVTAAGCLGLGLGAGRPAPAVRAVELANGAVVVAAPTGYCVEPGSVEASAGRGFALLGRCDLLAETDGPAPVSPAVLTVSVAAAAQTDAPVDGDSLARALGEERILDRVDDPGLTLLRVDSAKPVIRSGDSRHWRAVMVVNGHTVGLAAYGAEGSNISGESGRYLLRALARRIRGASPEAPPAPTRQGETDEAE